MASYNPYQKPGESLEHWYRRVAKTADQRLVRLESYQHDKDFKPATQWAYKKAQRDIRRWSGTGANRFNVNPPKSEEKLRAKIGDIINFLESGSSTKQGIIKTYKQRADTLNRKYGTNFKWNELSKFFDSESAKKWFGKFGSKTVFKTIGVIQRNRKEVIKALDQHRKAHIDTESPYVEAMVNKALADSDLKIEELF